MFTQKVPKSQSSSKLLKILTKRSSLKKISNKKGIYDEWPTQKKPSLFNYPSKYLKYVNNQQNESQQKEKNKGKGLKKVSATFSTCTTMEFYAPNQQKTRILSKFVSTPKSQESEKEVNLTQYQNSVHNRTFQRKQIEIRDLQDSKFTNQNDSSFQQMNSKYVPVKRPLQRKSSNFQKRLVQTAKIDRQKIQEQVGFSNQTIKESRKSSIRPNTACFSRPKTAKTIIQQKKNQPEKNKSLCLNSSKLIQNYGSQNQQSFSKYPLRLKDYETNFQAYKVISDLIDKQMKWQPKRSRPKSSVAFKKMNQTLKY